MYFLITLLIEVEACLVSDFLWLDLLHAQYIYSGFRLMGPPVKRVSHVIGPLWQKQKWIRIKRLTRLSG